MSSNDRYSIVMNIFLKVNTNNYFSLMLVGTNALEIRGQQIRLDLHLNGLPKMKTNRLSYRCRMITTTTWILISGRTDYRIYGCENHAKPGDKVQFTSDANGFPGRWSYGIRQSSPSIINIP